MCLYFCITVVFYSDLFYPMWMYVCCIWINQSVSQSVTLKKRQNKKKRGNHGSWPSR